MVAKGYERPDPQQPRVRTAAFCFITDRASIKLIQQPTQIDAPGRPPLRRECWASLAVALRAPRRVCGNRRQRQFKSL